MTPTMGTPESRNAPGRIIGMPMVGRDGLLLPADRRRQIERPPSWPLKGPADPTLAWWRSFPPGSFDRFDQRHQETMLRRISVLRGGEELAPAMRGEAGAAIGAALAAMPVGGVTLRVDNTVSSSALNRQAAASLVTARAIGLSDLADPPAPTLANSWLEHGIRHSSDPDKLGEGAGILRQEFRKRQDAAEKAVFHLDRAAPLTVEPVA